MNMKNFVKSKLILKGENKNLIMKCWIISNNILSVCKDNLSHIRQCNNIYKDSLTYPKNLEIKLFKKCLKKFPLVLKKHPNF